MAKTAIQPNRQRLEALVEIIDDVLDHPLTALQRAALCFAHSHCDSMPPQRKRQQQRPARPHRQQRRYSPSPK